MLESRRTWRAAAAVLFVGVTTLMLEAAPFQAASQLPVAYWNLDEAGSPNVDSIGGVNASWTGGVARSTVLPGTTFSYGNTASLDFSTAAAPDYSTIAAGSSLDSLQVNSYSIACWFRPNTLPTGTARFALVIKKGDNEGISLRPENVFEFEHWSSDFAHLVNPGTWSQAPITAGTWYHVVGAWDGTANTAYIFLNGVQADTRVLSGGSGGANLTTPWTFGIADPAAANAADRWQADGNLDDVRFYNYAFNANQASVLAAGVPAPTGLGGSATGGDRHAELDRAPAGGDVHLQPRAASRRDDRRLHDRQRRPDQRQHHHGHAPRGRILRVRGLRDQRRRQRAVDVDDRRGHDHDAPGDAADHAAPGLEARESGDEPLLQRDGDAPGRRSRGAGAGRAPDPGGARGPPVGSG